MEDVLSAVIATRDASPKARREQLAPYADRAGIGRMFTYALAGRETRAMLRAILDVSSSPGVAEIAAHYLEIHRDQLPALLFAEDAKVRKSTAQLLGKIAPTAWADLLLEALRREPADMVRPSVILALGNCKGNAAVREALEHYVIPPCEEKHQREHRLALDKALSSLAGPRTRKEPLACAVPPGMEAVLFCPNANVTLGQLRQQGTQARLYHQLDHTILAEGLSDLAPLYALRSFFAAGVLCGSFPSLEEAASYCQSRAFAKLVPAVFGEDALAYRVEASGQEISHQARKAAAEAIALGLSQVSPLRNSPSSYDFSILLLRGRRAVSVALTPSPVYDARFRYRKDAISASIHPAVAASVMAFSAGHFQKSAAVLDCFCGSGTMLFERAFYPYASLTGTDVSADALAAARRNERRRRSGARFLIKNAVSPFREQFDEVICNMPFGLRVGNHDANLYLYRDFAQNLRRLLKRDGTAFLFTNEKQLLARMLQDSFEIVAKASFSAGGLYPSLFIARHREG